MRITRSLVVVGVAAIAIAGVATAAVLNTHTLTLRLPDGGIERIIYTGNVPPRVEVAPTGAPVPVVWAAGPDFDDSAFAAMDRMSAQMDEEMAAMFRRADALQAGAMAGPGALTHASTAALPPGAQSISLVSTLSGGGVCSRSVEITSAGEGQKSHVVSHSYGHCGNSNASTTTQSPDMAPSAAQSGNLVKTSYPSAVRGSSGDGPA